MSALVSAEICICAALLDGYPNSLSVNYCSSYNLFLSVCLLARYSLFLFVWIFSLEFFPHQYIVLKFRNISFDCILPANQKNEMQRQQLQLVVLSTPDLWLPCGFLFKSETWTSRWGHSCVSILRTWYWEISRVHISLRITNLIIYTMQNRKRKQNSSSGAANSTGTGPCPSPSSPPSTHTPGDGVNAASSLRCTNGAAKSMTIHATEGSGGPASSTNLLVWLKKMFTPSWPRPSDQQIILNY